MAGQHSRRRILHLEQTVVAHLEYADLVGRAVAVFRRTQTAERTAGFALKVQHAVHHVLKNFRTCQRALLVNVANNENRHVAVFRVLHQAHRAFLDLRRTAGSSGQIALVNGLNGVHDQDIRLEQFGFVDDLLHVGLREDVQIGRRNVQACRANLDLFERFLARNIEYARVFAHFLTHLQQ